MMSPELRDKMKPVIGNRYVSLVNQKLTEKGLKNYSQPYISNVFSGKESNTEIETCLFELYNQKLKAYKKQQKAVEKILKEKPEAVTPGSV